MVFETKLVEVDKKLEDGYILAAHLHNRFPELTFSCVRDGRDLVLLTDEEPETDLVEALKEFLGVDVE